MGLEETGGLKETPGGPDGHDTEGEAGDLQVEGE